MKCDSLQPWMRENWVFQWLVLKQLYILLPCANLSLWEMGILIWESRINILTVLMGLSLGTLTRFSRCFQCQILCFKL